MSNEPNEVDPPSGAPKIIVDSDWKDQVAKEKEMASEAVVTPSDTTDEAEPASPSDVVVESTPPSSEPPSSDAVPTETQSTETPPTETPPTETQSAETKPSRPQQLPPPTFEVLISMLFTQAISALGQMPNPIDGETNVDKPMAKHTIDMLDMLSVKTKGNLTDDESKMLSEALHQLRIGYVSVRG